jgi:hypothetical protein
VGELVSKNRQKEAVDFLNRQLYATPYWLTPPAIISRTGDDPLTLIGGLQRLTFDILFSLKLKKMVAQEAVAGDETYLPIDLLNDLKKGIWGELITHKPIDIYRRNLQINYLNSLSAVLRPQDGGGAISELSGLVRGHLSGLRKEVAAALPAAADAETRYHLQEVLKRIGKMLEVDSRL